LRLLAFVILPVAAGWGITRIDLPLPLAVKAYEDGRGKLFSDRPYVNAAADPGLTGFKVVPIPRHLRFDIELSVSEPARIVRLLCDRNDNGAFADWEPLRGFAFDVPGRSCTLRNAVVKSFAAGSYRLPPAGPVCSSPLLIASAGRIEARTIRALNKLVSYEGEGWRAFLAVNARKLLAGTGAYVGYCLVLGWLMRRRSAR